MARFAAVAVRLVRAVDRRVDVGETGCCPFPRLLPAVLSRLLRLSSASGWKAHRLPQLRLSSTPLVPPAAGFLLLLLLLQRPRSPLSPSLRQRPRVSFFNVLRRRRLLLQRRACAASFASLQHLRRPAKCPSRATPASAEGRMHACMHACVHADPARPSLAHSMCVCLCGDCGRHDAPFPVVHHLLRGRLFVLPRDKSRNLCQRSPNAPRWSRVCRRSQRASSPTDARCSIVSLLHAHIQ